MNQQVSPGQMLLSAANALMIFDVGDTTACAMKTMLDGLALLPETLRRLRLTGGEA